MWIVVVLCLGITVLTICYAPRLKAAHIDIGAKGARVAENITVFLQVDVRSILLRNGTVLSRVDGKTGLMKLIVIRSMTGEVVRKLIDVFRPEIRRERIASLFIAVHERTLSCRTVIGNHILTTLRIGTVIVEAVDDLTAIADRSLSCCRRHSGTVEHRTIAAHADYRLPILHGVAIEQSVIQQSVLEVHHGMTDTLIVFSNGITIDNHIPQHQSINLVGDVYCRCRQRLVAVHLHTIDKRAEVIIRCHCGDTGDTRTQRRLSGKTGAVRLHLINIIGYGLVFEEMRSVDTQHLSRSLILCRIRHPGISRRDTSIDAHAVTKRYRLRCGITVLITFDEDVRLRLCRVLAYSLTIKVSVYRRGVDGPLDHSTAVGILPVQSRELSVIDMFRVHEEHTLHCRRALVGAALHTAVIETHLVGQVLGVGSIGEHRQDIFLIKRNWSTVFVLNGHSRHPSHHLSGIEQVAGACQRAHTRIDMIVAQTDVLTVTVDEVRPLHSVVVTAAEAHVVIVCIVLICIRDARDGIILHGVANGNTLILHGPIVVLVVLPDDGVVERRGSFRLIRELDMSAVHGEGTVDDAHGVGTLQRIARTGVEHTVVDERAAAALLHAHGRHRRGSSGTILLEDTVLDGQFRHAANGVEVICG